MRRSLNQNTVRLNVTPAFHLKHPNPPEEDADVYDELYEDEDAQLELEEILLHINDPDNISDGLLFGEPEGYNVEQGCWLKYMHTRNVYMFSEYWTFFE